MEVEVVKKLFTVDDYHQMADAGILGPEDRVELIEGEIVQMAPIGYRHIACVNRANELLILALANKAIVSPQNAVRLTQWTEPQPDIVVFKLTPDFYETRMPTAADALLVIEISDSSFKYDSNVKRPHYASAGVPEFWIEDLKNDLLLVFRDPVGK